MLNQILTGIGYICAFYYLCKFVLAFVARFVNITTLKAELKRYHNISLVDNKQPVAVLFCLDEECEYLLKLIQQLSMSKIQIMLVLNHVLSYDDRVCDAIKKLEEDSALGRKTVTFFKNTNNLPEQLTTLEGLIKEHNARLMVILSDDNSLNRNTQTFTLETSDLEHIDLKVKLSTMITTCFIKANKDSLSKSAIILKNPTDTTAKPLFSFWPSFKFHMEAVQNEVKELRIRYFSE